MSTIKVRICLSCQEYFQYDDNDMFFERRFKLFEKRHKGKGHSLVDQDISELAGSVTAYIPDLSEKEIKKITSSKIKNNVNRVSNNNLPLFSIIGGLNLILGSFFGFIFLLSINGLLEQYGEELSEYNIDISLFYVQIGTTLLLGISAICAGFYSYKDRLIGGIICIVISIVAIVGFFITIGHVDMTSVPDGKLIPVSLNDWGFGIDPFFILIGGILCLYSLIKPKTQEEYFENLKKKKENNTEEINREKQKKREVELKRRLGTNFIEN